MLGLSLVPSVILLIEMYFMPETPRWLVKQNLEEDAREVLRQARSRQNVEDELGEIKRIASEEEQTNLRDLLAPWVRPALVVAIGIGPLFLGYAVIGIIAFLFVVSQVTETKGRSLEQIEIDLRERSLVM